MTKTKTKTKTYQTWEDATACLADLESLMDELEVVRDRATDKGQRGALRTACIQLSKVLRILEELEGSES